MRVIIDTNVILDILLKREPFFTDSYGTVKKALESHTDCFVSASAVTDIFYLLRKGLQDNDAARQAMEQLLQLVYVADVLALDIHSALSVSIPDFEDAVVAAVALRNKADYIITRNQRDFTGSIIPEITPHDFMVML